MKTVGIIGGMGPAASIDLYSKITSLTPAQKDQDHVHIIIDSFSAIPDRTGAILNGTKDPTPYLIKSALALKAAGADAIAMACNTAHYYADEIEKASSLKVLHIAKIAVNALLDKFKSAKNIAVIATTGTRRAGIYDNILFNKNLTSISLSANQENELMSCIYDGAKAGKIAEYAPRFKSVIDGINADAFIAGCTEVPLFLPYLSQDVRDKFIDSTNELAKEIIKFCKEE